MVNIWDLFFNFNWVTTTVMILTVIIIISMIMFPQWTFPGGLIAIGVLWLFMWIYNLGENIGVFIKENPLIVGAAGLLLLLYFLLRGEEKIGQKG